MTELSLHQFHAQLGASFLSVEGWEAVGHYGDWLGEHRALKESAGVLDLSLRSRVCLTGADRQRFLNGQVTNNIKDLKTGEGSYAALVTAKGRMQSDLNVYILPDELLLDFEPGLTAGILERFEKYTIADDVQGIDVAPHYGLLSVQGPRAKEMVERSDLGLQAPERELTFNSVPVGDVGELYCMAHRRTSALGFDLYVPMAALAPVAQKLITAARTLGGGPCGWQALEISRIEAGIPRFGVDMDVTNLPPETGIEARAISYSKGCYIGQEVIARIRTYGQVAKTLRGLQLADDLDASTLPKRGDKLFRGEAEVGYITSAIESPAFQRNVALGYVRREANQAGTELEVRSAGKTSRVRIVDLPFQKRALTAPPP